MTGAQSLLAELRRRNVFRAAAIYAATVWALAQGIAQLGPSIGLSDWVTRWFLVAAIIGFPFWIVFAWFYAWTPQGFRREEEVKRNQALAHSTGRKLDFAIIGILAVAVVLLATNQFVLRGDATSRAHAKALAGIPAMSVAVLPLANASPDKNQVYFSDGLSEDLINNLSQFQNLKVISAHSSFQFRNTRASAQEIGAKLGVAHLVEGSVRHAGDMVRITAQLVNVADGRTLWSEHYDRPYKDLFALQDTVTTAIADALKAKLLPGAKIDAASRRPPNGNVDAYAAFLRGKTTANKANSEADPEQGYQKALAELDTAVQLDPHYAAAIANEALVWVNLTTVRTGAAKQQAIAKARELMAKAQALAPDNVTVLNALAGLHSTLDHNRGQAVAEYRRAIQADPHAVFSKDNLAAVLVTLGQPQEAVALLHEALQTDPLNAFAYSVLSPALVAMGNLDAAAAAARKMVEVQPSSATMAHAQLATIEILRGNAAAALTEARQAPTSYGTRDAAVALALQIGSDRSAADAALKALIAHPAGDQLYGAIADVYALRKDSDQVFAWLDSALRNGEDVAATLLADPFLKPYRHDPRFAALRKQLGLPAPGDVVATP